MRVTLLGMQGSGKGSHAPLLADYLRVPLIPIGDMMRDRREVGDELAAEIDLFMSRGELVPDEVVAQALAERLAEPAARAGFVLDGYPRRADQGKTLETMLAALPQHAHLDLAIYLEIDAETARERLLARLVCDRCRRPTSTAHAATGGPCPAACGGIVHRRDDDQDPASLQRRLETFATETFPLIGHYDRAGRLARVDARKPQAAVFEDIVAHVERRRTSVSVA